MTTAVEERSWLRDWWLGFGRGLVLWGPLGALAYRLILWQDTGQWPPVTFYTVTGLRLDLSWLGLQSWAAWLSGLPIEAWFVVLGGLLLAARWRR